MRNRRLPALAALALAAAALSGCSSSQSASSDHRYQMVRITEEMLDRGSGNIEHPVMQLSAGDDWGLMVYEYYLAHRDQPDQGQAFVKAEPDAPAE
jgi:type IV pilus biogenesis protein CpaD/CtpE